MKMSESRTQSCEMVDGDVVTLNHAENLEYELRCPGCAGPLSPPINLCTGGHSFCNACRGHLNECPVCKDCDDETAERKNNEKTKSVDTEEFTKTHNGCMDTSSTNATTKQKGIGPNIQESTLHQGKQGLHGDTYHIKLLMLFFIRGINNGYNFRLGKEMKNAKKFDDVFFEVTNDDNCKEFRLLQAKHKKNESDKIRFSNLLTTNDSDYSLVKYFFSYQDSKKEKFLKDGKIRDVIVCTNIDLDVGDQCTTSSGATEKLANVVNKITEVDDVLYVDKPTASRYRLNKNIIPLLKPLLQEYNLTRLARKLVECLLKNKEIQRKDKNNIFHSYHVILAAEVLDIPNKKFRQDFVTGELLTDNASKFRQALEAEILKQSKNELSLSNINEGITDRKITLKIPKKFGEGKNKGWPNNAISDKDLNAFIQDLVFAVNQPGEDELGEIIKEDLLNQFDQEKDKNIYNELCVKMLDWLNGKDKEFFTHEDGKTFFANILGAVWFGVGPLVECFTGRTEELNKLHSLVQRNYKLTIISQTTSITGLGGVGKSELARKYAYEYRKYYDDNVIWINAASNSTLEESFRTLAENKLGIRTVNTNGQEKCVSTIIQQVYNFFSSRKCLFIFDNAEFYKSIKAGDAGIDKFMPLYLDPNANKPYCLITSRNKKWGDNTEEIKLDVFKEEEAISLIKAVLNINHTTQDNDLIMLSEKLEYFPLALCQAVAYIKEKNDILLRNIGEPFQIKEYLNRLEEKAKDLLDFEFPEGSTNSYTKTTFIVWEVTLETILTKRYGKEALEVLDIMAYFAPNDIPISIFSGLIPDKELLASSVELLKQYSMITSSDDPTMLNIHRLVQQVATIKHGNRVQSILSNALQLIMQCFNTFAALDMPVSDLEVTKMQMPDNMLHDGNYLRILYIPHALSAWKSASKFRSLVDHFSEFPRLIVGKMNNSVGYEATIVFAQQLLHGLEIHLDTNHIDILKVRYMIFSLLTEKNQYAEALKGLRTLLTTVENMYSDQHQFIINIKSNIITVLMFQEDYDVALKMAKSALSDIETKLDNELELLLNTNRLIALILFEQKNYEESLRVADKVLQAIGNSSNFDPFILSIYSLKAIHFYNQGQYDTSLEFNQKMLNIGVKNLASYHPYVLKIRNNIGVILRRQGKYEESLGILKTCLQNASGKLPPDCSDCLLVEYNIGITLSSLQRYSEAFRYFEQILINIHGKPQLGKYLHHCILVTETHMTEILENYKYSLHVAVENNFTFLIKLILKETTHLWNIIEDDKGKTALNYASDNSIRNLLKATEALFTELENGDVENVQTCLAGGAEVNALGPLGARPIHCAVRKGQVEVVRLLLKNKADPNLLCKDGYTSLHHAVKAGNLKIINTLLENSAKPNIADKSGELPVDLARKLLHQSSIIYEEIIEILNKEKLN